MVLSIIFTAQVTGFIRSLVQTPSKGVAKAKKASPFMPSHFFVWGGVALGSLAGIYFQNTLANTLALPFMLSCTICGYLIGNVVPPALQVCVAWDAHHA